MSELMTELTLEHFECIAADTGFLGEEKVKRLIASHRALQRELKSLTDVNNHNAFRLFGMSIEEARTLQRERDDLKRQVEEANKIIYNAKFLAKEVAE
jgi:hypothetical protein